MDRRYLADRWAPLVLLDLEDRFVQLDRLPLKDQFAQLVRLDHSDLADLSRQLARLDLGDPFVLAILLAPPAPVVLRDLMDRCRPSGL